MRTEQKGAGRARTLLFLLSSCLAAITSLLAASFSHPSSTSLSLLFCCSCSPCCLTPCSLVHLKLIRSCEGIEAASVLFLYSHLLSYTHTHPTLYNMTVLRAPSSLVFAPSSKPPSNVMVVESRDGDGNTALLFAIAHGFIEQAMALLKNGASVRAANFNGETALHLAARLGNDALVAALLQAGARCNHATTADGASPLHLAVQGGHVAVVKRLVFHGAWINARDEEGDTVLHWAVREGHETLLAPLVQLGADINAQNDDGESALHLAICFGDACVVKKLLVLGADPNVLDALSHSPMHEAISNGHRDLISLLLEHGARVPEHHQHLKKESCCSTTLF